MLDRRAGSEEGSVFQLVSRGLTGHAVEWDAETSMGKHRGSSSPCACWVLSIINGEAVGRMYRNIGNHKKKPVPLSPSAVLDSRVVRFW